MSQGRSLTLITISFNAQETIGGCMDSVLSVGKNLIVTGCYIEHLIIDGRSTDKTLAVVESRTNEYTKNGIELSVYSEKDEGISDAFNKGIKLAKGSFISFINSDDRLLALNPFFEDKQVEVANLVYGKKLRVPKINRLPFYMSVNHPGVIVPKYLAPTFDKSFKFAMDYDWFLKLTRKKLKLVVNNSNLLFYATDGISGKYFHKALREQQAISPIPLLLNPFLVILRLRALQKIWG